MGRCVNLRESTGRDTELWAGFVIVRSGSFSICVYASLSVVSGLK